MPGLPGFKGKITIGPAAQYLVAEMGAWNVSGQETEMHEDTEFLDEQKSYVPGRLNGGTVTFSGNYDPTNTFGQGALITAWQTKAAVSTMRFYYSVAGYFEVSSGGSLLVQSIDGPSVDQSGIGTIGFTLKISGGYLEKKA